MFKNEIANCVIEYILFLILIIVSYSISNSNPVWFKLSLFCLVVLETIYYSYKIIKIKKQNRNKKNISL